MALEPGCDDWVECPVPDSFRDYIDRPIPDYLNSLDAMHGAKKAMNDEQKHAYCVILASTLWLPAYSRGWQDWRDTWLIDNATARQRNTAFLMTLLP